MRNGRKPKGRKRVRLSTSDTRVRLNSSTREKFEWTPQWDSVFSGWAKKYLLENKWRCDPVLDLDDLMQEAFIVFNKVIEAYPMVTEPKHFMSLFKTSIRNFVFSLSRIERQRLNFFNVQDPTLGILHSNIGVVLNEGYLKLLLDEAPKELKLFLEAFNDEGKLFEMRKPLREKENDLRESFNTRLSKMIGLKERANLKGMLKDLLSN